MANLKQDLLNKLGNEKYYDELELARLAQDPNTNYKEKVEKMSKILKDISSVDVATQLINKYFQEPQQTENQNLGNEPTQPKQPEPHPGQTHSE